MLGCDLLKLTAAVRAGGGSTSLDGFSLDENTLQLTADLADGAPAITSAKLIVHYCGCEFYARCDVDLYSPSNGRLEFPVVVTGNQLTSDLSSLASTTDLLIDHLEYELQTECGETIHAVISNDSEYDFDASTCSVNFGKFMFCAAPALAGDGDDPDLSGGSTRTPASCGANPSVAGATQAAPVSVSCDELVTEINFDDVNNNLVISTASGLPALTSSSVNLSQCPGDAGSCAAGVQKLVSLGLFENGANLETTLPSAADASTGRIHAATVVLETSCNATYLISISNPNSSTSFSLRQCYGYVP